MFGLEKTLFLIVFPIVLNSFEPCYGHGYVLDPVARGSRWRFNTSALPNYDDNSLFCGGFNVSIQVLSYSKPQKMN
jgi:hypothetical protein